MRVLPHYRGGGVAALCGWTPWQLGAAQLFAWWDAEQASTVTQSGGLVSSWADLVAGYAAVQAGGSAKPVYGATSFNGRPGLTFDATDDRLRSSSMPAGLPLGASACWIWGLVSQDLAAATATNRDVMGYGDVSATANTRRLQRTPNAGVNRGAMLTGDNSTGVTAINGSVDLSGRHLMIGKAGATSTDIYVNGTAGTPQAAVPSTNTGNVTIGAAPNGGSFWGGVINSVLVTAPLGASDEARLGAYLSIRK